MEIREMKLIKSVVRELKLIDKNIRLVPVRQGDELESIELYYKTTLIWKTDKFDTPSDIISILEHIIVLNRIINVDGNRFTTKLKNKYNNIDKDIYLLDIVYENEYEKGN